MKTITTTLPIYDKLAKQTYQKAIVNKEQTGQDMPVPIACPRHRLPSLLWNVQSDNPGEIEKIELVGTSGDNAELANGTYVHAAAAYETFIVSGTAITSAINSVTQATAIMQSNFPISIGEYVTIRFTLILNSGQLPGFYLYLLGFSSSQWFQAKVGYNEVTFKSDFDSPICKILIYNASAANWSTDAISIKKNDITTFFNTTAAYIQNGGGAGFNSATYDTFVSVNKNITSAIKTTAAGVATCWNVYAVNSAPNTINAGDSIRIRANLTLNSGTAPKCVLQRIDTGVNISNIVTLTAGVNYFFLTATSTITGFAIAFYNGNGETCNWSCDLTLGEKSVIPKLYTALTDDYFQYKGTTLGTLLPCGTWYLKITTANGYVYYSDWFTVTSVYENLISAWIVNITYDTFTSSGTAITSAIEIGADGAAYTGYFPVKKGDVIKVITNVNLNGGTLPYFVLRDKDTAAWISNSVQTVIGLNEITLTATANSNFASLLAYQFGGGATNYSTTDIVVMRAYSEKYLTINFSNTCDLGDIVYQDGFTQSLWFESETMENTYPTEEEGQKNGEGRFIRTFARLVKKYLARTKDMPGYMVEVFNTMKLHNTVEIIDLVGDENDVYNIEVEHEWLFDDKYYAKLDLTFDYNEATVVSGCCTNKT